LLDFYTLQEYYQIYHEVFYMLRTHRQFMIIDRKFLKMWYGTA